MNHTYLCVVINSYNSCVIHGDCRVLTILVFRSVTNTLLYLFHNALDHSDSSALPGHFTRTILSFWTEPRNRLNSLLREKSALSVSFTTPSYIIIFNYCGPVVQLTASKAERQRTMVQILCSLLPFFFFFFFFFWFISLLLFVSIFHSIYLL